MSSRNEPHLTVGSLLGLPLGRVPETTPGSLMAPSTEVERSTDAEANGIEGPNWQVSAGEARVGRPTAWRSDGVEALTYDNPFGQVMERVWFDGKIVFAVDLGAVRVDANEVAVAQEYQPVYSAELDEHGRAIGVPERVDGQLNIYDTVPGMDRYSPIWQFNYVIVPRTYTVNALRSEADCLASGFPILRSQDFEN